MPIKRLLVVVGPTGSGKTDLSIRLALHYGAPILSTDSRQVYRGMPIGTAQPSVDQLQAVEHHFIASHDLTDNLNCGEYEVQALARLEELFADHDWVVAVGGSGLYVRALCEGMDDLPQADEPLRRELERRLAEEGLGALAEELRELDPEYCRTADLNNPARVMRALEVCLQTHMPYSRQRTGERRPRPFEIVKIGIDLPRDVLYDRINRRVDRMLADGLEAEARALYPYRELNALKTVGYREFFDYFDGRIGYDEAVELIKRNSRRYAKRQLTWFRRDSEIRWFAPDDDAAIIAYVGSK
ncbi:tRNA (adenosine(37)-N6)-dimethylallyltransferase MiaA [Alistipes senegalensis]|jgi:tRNA dimethylallyltransferase|uniref:tRNA (adenosine(37)-N6)-dimethylallyltransferase MiaA n=1 Tax=Alistipes senegalensis TaxID=1288121 RepID=UPI00243197AD|nr:tRNA (adenosine(37)-N6)-dimethylallyltransferase MiaA [Alistipes senegalensis]MCI7306792.1 tRNA (adenosine(37)-N6)-dimethylallyltransferase MiaA [Alistipes senegalensis]MDY2876485.1 tRNA (adenosine(37)-N6)-dimethylallyltransferase MiaA [Alistipes senegalensis]